MQDSSEGQCERETVYSCQREDGFVLCLADTSEVPIARLIWVLSDTQQAAYSAASAAGTLYPSASSLLSPIATGACSLLCLLTPAHQLCHFHFPILCVPAPFSCQASESICLPLLKHYTFSPFPLGLQSCRVSLGLYFVPQLSHYTQEQKCHSSGQDLELGQWQKLLCAVFTAVHPGKANAWYLHGLTTSMTKVVYPIPYPYNWRRLYLISVFCSWLSSWQSLNWCRAAAIAFGDILPCRKAAGKWQIRFPRRSTSYSSALELFWNKKHLPCWQS